MSKSTSRIILPTHNTGVAPGAETIDALSAAVPGAAMLRGDTTAAAIAAVGVVAVADGETAPALPLLPSAQPPSQAMPQAQDPVPAASPLAVTASANNDVMALIRGRGDAAVEPMAPQPVAPPPSPQPQPDAALDARLRVVETFAFSLDSKLSTHRQGIDDSLRAAFGQIREEFNRIEAQIAELPTTKSHDYDQDIAALRASLSAVAAAHGIVVETPTIRMKQRRFLTHPASVEGGYVVLYYNPRPEENPEIQVRANQPRMVWTGYSFTIPDGYVADIWSAGRCVASFAGATGDGDFRIPVLGTSDAGLAVSTGREVARLTLRRIEPVAIAVDRAGFGG
jgi:hypothetical protein